MARNSKGGSANKSPNQGDERTPYSTDGTYPDFNSPINVSREGAEPGPEVWNEVAGDKAEAPNDPNDYINHLAGGGRGKR